MVMGSRQGTMPAGWAVTLPPNARGEQAIYGVRVANPESAEIRLCAYLDQPACGARAVGQLTTRSFEDAGIGPNEVALFGALNEK